MSQIKVCGITRLEQLQQLHDAGIAYAGIIFYPLSTRYAIPTLGERGAEVRRLSIKKIGVFVNEASPVIERAVTEYDLYAVQLHGDETPAFCQSLKTKTKVIKAFRVKPEANLDSLVSPYQEACDYFLFDTSPAAASSAAEPGMYGGTGKQFDWNLLASAKINKPFFLSGGIGPEDVEQLHDLSHPFLHAVDINSRFESLPGVKNMDEVRKFSAAAGSPNGWR